MTDTLMVPGSGTGLLVNEAGILAVGQNCCECQGGGCSCLPRCQEATGTWQLDWSINFSFGTLTGSAVNGDAEMTWSGGSCDDAYRNCQDCPQYPVACGEGFAPYTFVAGCGGQYASLVDAIKAMCLANSTAMSVTQVSDANCDPIDPVTVTINFPYDVIDWEHETWGDDLWKIIFAMFCADCFLGESGRNPPKLIGYVGIGSASINYGPTSEGLETCTVEEAEAFDTPIEIPTTCVYDYGVESITYDGYSLSYGRV